MISKIKKIFIFAASMMLLPFFTSAHEAYVLPKDFFWKELANPVNYRAFTVLANQHDFVVILKVTTGILILIFLNFIFRLSSFGTKVYKFFERFATLGPVFVRVAIAGAFFFGAYSGAFLGPELQLTQMPYANILQICLYIISGMIFLGLFTEIAAVAGLIIFTIGFLSFGTYLATYLNYLGELIVLALFGMRKFSLDKILFGPLKKMRAKLEPYETTIIRIFYGFALIYAGVTIKFLHPSLTLHVVNEYNLTQFNWLFPADPLLVVFGGGLAEIVIGLFIMIGFEMRMIVLISLFYITLSLAFFRELVWPHILLYGISFNLLVQPEIFTIDHLIFKHHRKTKSIWQRLISSHRTST
jgi:uncharacterized membrane protein YphA (DoxX/SURF4 family)